MSRIPVTFDYEPGLSSSPFAAATLVGSWDEDGQPRPSPWSATPMAATATPDGSASFTATVELDGVGTPFSWGVWAQRADGATVWGVFAEVPDENSRSQFRTFTLGAAPHRESYRLSWHRARGAYRADDAVVFEAWAPNASAVDVVFGAGSGYIADDGDGQATGAVPLAMTATGDGRWRVVQDGFAAFVDRRYLYRVTRDDGSVHWATDMFSRQQVGTGDVDPQGGHYVGTPAELNGRPSCSVVADPTVVFSYPSSAPVPVADRDFWADEHDPARPVPHRVEDLVIYELHVGALDPTTRAAGTFADALDLIPYLVDLGINAVELMPMFQFDGTLSWGYGSSHFLAIDSTAGGRDALKQFVKTCHRHGIAVLMDVVYNHYTGSATRAAWQYDSTAASRNIYYWYEGVEAQYPDPSGGYVDNDSSGWAPDYRETRVRELFVSSAAVLADEFHIDGLRVDQTASIHSYNALHADGRPVGTANIFGRKFLRELCGTLKAVRPDQVLIAEDHSGWPVVTQPADTGGIGFDATWYVDFYHHLVGETGRGPEWAKLLLTAGQDPTTPLAMDFFAAALATSGARKVVYESSHDEAGNDAGTARTILVAVNGAPLVGETRRYAEARCRFACGMSMLSAGTPMFLMGEEVGAEKPYTYDKFNEQKEDLAALRRGTGAALFRFYQDVIRFRLGSSTLRSRNIEIVHTNNAARVLAFRRWGDGPELLVVGSLNNSAFDAPDYVLSHPALGDAGWCERFNSDSSRYGGTNIGNAGAVLPARGGILHVIVPANGFVVLERVG